MKRCQFANPYNHVSPSPTGAPLPAFCLTSSLPIAIVPDTLVMLEPKGLVLLVDPMTYARPT